MRACRLLRRPRLVCIRAKPLLSLTPPLPLSSFPHRVQVLERLQPATLRVLRLVCRGWEAASSRLLRHLRPETVVGKQLGHRFPALRSLDLSNCQMGVDFASPRMLRLQVRPATPRACNACQPCLPALHCYAPCMFYA